MGPLAKASRRLLLVGNPSPEHIGAHLLAAAEDLGIEARILDVREAWCGPRWLRRLSWNLASKRPTALTRFSRKVLETCREYGPDMVLCTGIAPVAAWALQAIGKKGIPRANYLTDDPWNPKNGAGFFWKALKEFDIVFSPRRSNLQDLQAAGCRRVIYLPFAYNPRIHFYEPPATEEERRRFACDLAILGGADEDRIPLALAAVRAGLKIKLYGGYWDRVKELRPFWGGFVFDRDLRLAASVATAHLCMGRRANRDGHAMRSFELPAMGACLIVEGTEEHRQLFGPEEHAVLYYGSIKEILDKARYLRDHPAIGRRLAARARTAITNGKHSYAERLSAIVHSVSQL